MNICINKNGKLLSGIAAVLMLAALVIGCKTNVSTPETFAVTFGVVGQNGSLKAKADGIAETDKSPITVEKGKTVTFTAYPASGYEVDKWTVNGTVITNTATTYSHKVTAKTDVKVLFKASAVAVIDVMLDKTELTLEEEKTEQLTATVTPATATNKKVTWSSDKLEVAVVDQKGQVTAKAEGTAKITVTTEDGSKTAECKVTVTAKAPPPVPKPKHTVTFSVEGGNGTLKAMVDGSEIHTGDKVEQDKIVTFTATPNSDYKVKEWKVDGAVVTGNASTTYTHTVTKVSKVTVSFESDSVPPTPPSGEFVTISPPAAGIVGVEPAYTLPGKEAYWKGVFIAGRTVKLSPYKLGKTEVPYEVWYEVRTWAESNGYVFANKGLEGWDGSGGGGSYPNYTNIGKSPTANKNHPVTMISWRDCIVWCNAYTQKTNNAESECVYRKSKTDTTVLKDATDTAACDAAYADMSKKGFRLPTEAEWEYAARWQNDSTNAEQYGEVWLTKLDSASGAKADWNNANETKTVAWYCDNSDSKTHPVGEKRSNALGLHDMSGNVWEWCFDRYDSNPAASDDAYNSGGFVTDPQGAALGANRVIRGGSWNFEADDCVVGLRDYYYPDSSGGPDNSSGILGFRVAMSKN